MMDVNFLYPSTASTRCVCVCLGGGRLALIPCACLTLACYLEVLNHSVYCPVIISVTEYISVTALDVLTYAFAIRMRTCTVFTFDRLNLF